MFELANDYVVHIMDFNDTRDRLQMLFEKTFQQATRSFSKLMAREMVIDHFRLEMLTSEEFSMEVLDQLEDTYFASIIKVEEHLDANIIFLIPEKEGVGLYQSISGDDADPSAEISDNIISGLGELNNILGGTFINILANYMGVAIHGSTPLNTYDMLGAILDGIALQEEFINREVICADAMIRERNHEGYAVRLIIMSDKERLIETLA